MSGVVYTVEPKRIVSLTRLWREYGLRIVVREESGGKWRVWIDNMFWLQNAWRDRRTVWATYEPGCDVLDVLVKELRTHRTLVIKRPWYRRDVEISLQHVLIER